MADPLLAYRPGNRLEAASAATIVLPFVSRQLLYTRRSFLSAAFLLVGPTTGQSWLPLGPVTTPTARYAHVMASDCIRGRVVMYGGVGATNITSEWDGKNWIQVRSRNTPAVWQHATMSFDIRRKRSVLFGGRDNGTTGNETWEWDGTNWQKISPATSPGPRFGGCQAYDSFRGRTVLFGGLNGSVYAPDTWEYDGKDWKKTVGPGPKGRVYSAMVFDSRRRVCVLFAGFRLGDLGDTWEWNGSTWKQVQTKSSPRARWGHSMTYDEARGVVVLFGGHSSSGSIAHRDTWTYDGTDWTRVATTARPSSRRHATASYDCVIGKTLLFGGFPSNAQSWHFDAGRPASYTPYGLGCTGSAGTPKLAAATNSLPFVDRVFITEITGIPATSPVAMILGASSSNWRTLSLPFKLDALGATGCSLLASVDQLIAIPNSQGAARLRLRLPNDSRLVGLRYHNQGVVADPSANALGITTSNAATALIGRR